LIKSLNLCLPDSSFTLLPPLLSLGSGSGS
jgi:hypothetical protein